MQLPVAGLVLLLMAAAFVRLHGAGDEMVSFHNTRQLHCAIITRAMYYRWTLPEGDPRRVVAEQAGDRRGRLEPPILQTLAAAGYVVTGGEHMILPRVFGVLCWLVGGVLLYACAARLFSPGAALIAAAYFLLLPYPVVASQAFMPDPLMIALMLASWLAIVRNDETPSARRLVLAGAIAGLAILVKPMCGIVIAFLYGALTLRRLGIAGVWKSREPWWMVALVIVPSALYYGSELLGGGRMRSQASNSLQPELWFRPEFWRGFRDQLWNVTEEHWLPILAVLGCFVAPSGRARVALWALALGYFAFGVTFTYHISTHDYYHLQAVPLIGLGLASVAHAAWRRVQLQARTFVAVVYALTGVFVVGWSIGVIEASSWPRTHGMKPVDPRYAEIGALTEHSIKVIFLDTNKYGGPLEFYGEVSGWLWPAWNDLRRAKRKGRPPLDWRAKLAELQGQGAQFFVSSPADELPKQRDLHRHLSARYPIISNSTSYLVYDLRKRLPGAPD